MQQEGRWSSRQFRSWRNAAELRVFAPLPLYSGVTEFIICCYKWERHKSKRHTGFYARGKKNHFSCSTKGKCLWRSPEQQEQALRSPQTTSGSPGCRRHGDCVNEHVTSYREILIRREQWDLKLVEWFCYANGRKETGVCLLAFVLFFFFIYFF